MAAWEGGAVARRRQDPRSAAANHEAEAGPEGRGGWRSEAGGGAQSSKRELLSRAGREPALGGVEAGVEGAVLEGDVRGSIGAKSASLTLLTGPLELGRMGVPWGTPAAMSLLERRPVGRDPLSVWGRRLERGWRRNWGRAWLPRRGSGSLLPILPAGAELG